MADYNSSKTVSSLRFPGFLVQANVTTDLLFSKTQHKQQLIFGFANFLQCNSPNKPPVSTAFAARVCRKYSGALGVLIVGGADC
jgi:hypothetical protein